ncbi:methyl-coenzyme M reductase [Acinetobacter lwoffii]|uniref:Methyl-coenzyme M reductase n=1 Tax=Acinetobacter lwoffii TaxID=28090 RepID=A0AAW8AUA5_ACILW|nr:methyl-coenzyme M reductase [Acinetobacter lwoffii]MDP1369202.1 methyl-coenzyme M reductase [Acinetobacter lwoffii]MDP1388656.1 methyl-coenzyme M reductase [Acinetobacter lwoffii]MDP1446354.1 methyl-coenzyme M reductase [Acinetobacter lwoffii]
MVLIPKSQGRNTSRPVMQQHTPMTGLSKIGETIGGVIDERRRKSDEADVSAKRAELYHNDLAEKEAKVKLDDVLTTELSEQVTLLKNDVANGAMDADVANKTLQQWSEKRFKDMEGELPGHAHQALSQHWSSNVTRNATAFLPLQLSADNKKGEVLADRYLEIGTRMDREAGAEYVKSNIQSLNIPEAQKQALIYKYQGARDLQDIDGRITSAIENKDTASLQQLVTEMDNGGFGYTDGPTLQQKKAQVLSRIDAINKQVEVEENKRLQLAGKALTEFKSQVMTGRALDDDYLQNMGAAVQGTEYEAEYNFYKSQSTNFQSFGRLSTAEMEKRVNQQKAKMANSKTADAVTEEKVLGVYESILNEKKQTIKDNPNQAVREAGLETHSLSAGEMKSNPKSFAAKAIDNGVSQMALKDPNIAVKPIAAEDLPEIKQALDGMGVNQKLDFIGNMITEAKGIPNGEKIWKSALTQLGGADRTYYLAGLAKAKNKKINNDDLASTLINGKFLVEKGGFVLPTDLESTFRERYGNLSNYGAFADDLTQFKYAYAVIANRDGVQHSKKDDVPNATAINKAFELATGGIYIQETDSWFGSFKTSGGGSFKNWKVPKPYGMSDDRFEAHLEKGYAGLSKMSGYTVAELKDLRLAPRIDRNTNTVMYNLLNERGLPLHSKDGKKTQFIIFDGVTR